MCRLLGYLGPAIALESLILQPSHSLMVQSYAPKELEVALLNADGFGFGWYDAAKAPEPFIYRNVMPMWNDPNVEPLCRYITTDCALAYVRSATPGQGVDISNCQPFYSGNLLFAHNGYIKNFRETLYRPMRQLMSDCVYASIHGNTDSEHIWGLVRTALSKQPTPDLVAAFATALGQLLTLAQEYDTPIAANVLISDGYTFVGSRLASHGRAPSLYWLGNNSQLPNTVIVASEPLFAAPWASLKENSLFTFNANRDLQYSPLSGL